MTQWILICIQLTKVLVSQCSDLALPQNGISQCYFSLNFTAWAWWGRIWDCRALATSWIGGFPSSVTPCFFRRWLRKKFGAGQLLLTDVADVSIIRWKSWLMGKLLRWRCLPFGWTALARMSAGSLKGNDALRIESQTMSNNNPINPQWLQQKYNQSINRTIEQPAMSWNRQAINWLSNPWMHISTKRVHLRNDYLHSWWCGHGIMGGSGGMKKLGMLKPTGGIPPMGSMPGNMGAGLFASICCMARFCVHIWMNWRRWCSSCWTAVSSSDWNIGFVSRVSFFSFFISFGITTK